MSAKNVKVHIGGHRRVDENYSKTQIKD